MKKQSKISDLVIAIVFGILMLLLCKVGEAQVLPEYSAFPKSSIGLQAGTQGLGLQGSYKIGAMFNVRAGFGALPGINLTYRGRDLQYNRSSVYLMADWQPNFGRYDWLSRNWFVSAGYGAYFSNNIYRQGYNSSYPNYTEQLSKSRPYIGTGLGNLPISGNVRLRLDLGEFIPTSKTTTTYDNGSGTITNGLQGLLPGLNAAATFYIRF